MSSAESSRRYREKDPERARAKNRRWREAHPEQVREAARRWREANPGKARENYRRSVGKLRASVLDHYGRTCACCGGADRLTVDHINGDGAAHRAQVGRSWTIYRWIVANGFPAGFQILCHRCNSSKRGTLRCRLDHAGTA